MTRAEHVMDGVFCVFAKGVCSLSLSSDLKAIVFAFKAVLLLVQGRFIFPMLLFIY